MRKFALLLTLLGALANPTNSRAAIYNFGLGFDVQLLGPITEGQTLSFDLQPVWEGNAQ
jgi:hypothetical protein